MKLNEKKEFVIRELSIFIIILIFTGCSVKDERLFQKNSILGDNSNKISDRKYQKELAFEYKIAPNDRLSIMVYVQSGAGSQQMNSILTSNTTSGGSNSIYQERMGLLVTQNGTVRLPLINSIKVVGLTEDEASKVLINEYKKYIRNPYVTVEITNQRIIVIGEVKKPGIVPIVNGTMNLVEVISRSGYLTPLAERTNVKIIRGDLRNPEIRTIDLTDGEALITSSLLLKPNDIVYVQARQMDGYNKAFKEIVPFFQTISAILNPFVQITTIKDGTLYPQQW